eukprot:scaffold46718_cov28-Prasinocladus_malaysianus.AAC.1
MQILVFTANQETNSRLETELEESREHGSRLEEQIAALKDFARSTSTELQDSQAQIQVSNGPP